MAVKVSSYEKLLTDSKMGKTYFVYEFMHNGTLKEHLRGADDEKITSWLKRLEIVENAARYYISQQLTEKSDIYSFGVILLELISGQEPILNDNFGLNCGNIVAWARSHIESGNIHAILDQSLDSGYNLQSVWKIAEVAIMCVKPKGVQRPPIF
ncbi:hypothetical protein PR202_ga04253 [Eleusine coracana subsp. coracana]|uniref:Uncharacterized protein n=1 Tax=Eleusine coracana subsp. coracana TaxID=191504 RepID=A0AAV5BPF2_ELECO|nr:hypothetical protein PR202_ga04253 [Eleusine coracana subsp. coracana]